VCATSNRSTDPTCTCPEINRYGQDCYECMVKNDPSVGPNLLAQGASCAAAANGSNKTSSAPPLSPVSTESSSANSSHQCSSTVPPAPAFTGGGAIAYKVANLLWIGYAGLVMTGVIWF
jgi:hypothetical protein